MSQLHWMLSFSSSYWKHITGTSTWYQVSRNDKLYLYRSLNYYQALKQTLTKTKTCTSIIFLATMVIGDSVFGTHFMYRDFEVQRKNQQGKPVVSRIVIIILYSIFIFTSLLRLDQKITFWDSIIVYHWLSDICD